MMRFLSGVAVSIAIAALLDPDPITALAALVGFMGGVLLCLVLALRPPKSRVPPRPR